MARVRTVYQGENMGFMVLGRKHVKQQQYTPDIPHILISITDPYFGKELPDCGEAELFPSDKRLDVLRLEFFDMDESCGNMPIFIKEKAHSVIDFVNKWKDKINLIVVQCEYGVSRSSGVAAALSKWINEDDSFFFANYNPNYMIYVKLLSVINDTPK